MPSLTLGILHDAGPLLALSIVVLVGVLAGALAKRVRLPRITGQILGGVLIGRAGFDLFGEEPLHALQPLTHVALGLMAVTVGSHLNVRRLKNAGRRLSFLLLTEATIVPGVVFLVMWGFAGEPLGASALFATCAIATAPATIVAIVSEARAKGVFVKTLVAAVALNNMACIFLFEVARALARADPDPAESSLAFLIVPARQLVLAVLLGAVMALVMEWIARWLHEGHRLTTATAAALFMTSGTASYLGISPLLACLFLGLVQTNITTTRDRMVDTVFSDFNPLILTVFFSLAGMHLSFEHAATAGLLAFLLFISRFAGKLASAEIAMRLAKATDGVRKNLGMALVPQAGVAVGLVILVQEDAALAGIEELFTAVVLTVVTANEVFGPILTRLALQRAGEAGMDRVRLIDFLQEENILTDFEASSKTEAIEKLVDLMVSSHALHNVDRDELLASVLEREAQASTCLGGGLAVPHGILPDDSASSMAGVMAISRKGLDFQTPDHRPVHCMVLLGTSKSERDRHLQVLATLAKTIGTDPAFQAQLFTARSPAHASELLHGEESEDFNYFLEDSSG